MNGEPRTPQRIPVVCIVDDDADVRAALTRLVRSAGLEAEAFASPGEFLRVSVAGDAACLLLDVHLPGMTGFELYDRLLDAGDAAPVIFITGRAGSDFAARSERARAIAWLEKPFDDEALLDAIRSAIGPERSPR